MGDNVAFEPACILNYNLKAPDRRVVAVATQVSRS